LRGGSSSGDPPVRGGVDFLGVEPGGVLEEAGEGRVLVLFLEGPVRISV
jgi:hypothetical protein